MWQGILSYKIHMLCHHPRTIGVELFQISPVVFGNKTFVCFPYIYIGKADFAPWQPCFSTGQIFFSRGSPNIFLSFSFWLPYQPDFCMEWKYFSNFERGPPKYNSCEVWWNSKRWCRRTWLKKLLTDAGQMMNGHIPIVTTAHLELKKIEDPNHMQISDNEQTINKKTLTRQIPSWGFLRLARKLKIRFLRIYIWYFPIRE